MLLVPDLRIPSLGTRLPAGLSGRRQSQDPADALRVLAGGSRIIDLWDSRNRFLFRKNKVELPVDVQQQLVVGLGGDQHNRSLGGLRAIAVVQARLGDTADAEARARSRSRLHSPPPATQK